MDCQQWTVMNGNSTVMDRAARQQWMAQRLLNGKDWCDVSSMAIVGKGQRERNGNGPQAQWRWTAMDNMITT
jgi:hypothetical protein